MNSFVVSNGDVIEIEGIEMVVEFKNGIVDISMDGGYAQDDDGAWWERDGRETVAWFDNPEDVEEMEVKLTAAQIAAAKKYRESYPIDIDDDQQ